MQWDPRATSQEGRPGALFSFVVPTLSASSHKSFIGEMPKARTLGGCQHKAGGGLICLPDPVIRGEGLAFSGSLC